MGGQGGLIDYCGIWLVARFLSQFGDGFKLKRNQSSSLDTRNGSLQLTLKAHPSSTPPHPSPLLLKCVCVGGGGGGGGSGAGLSGGKTSAW